jgi:LytR cell envelope-related transcriptional attenuator
MAQSRARKPVVGAGGNNGAGGGSNIRMVVIALAALALGGLVLYKALPKSSGPKTTTTPGATAAPGVATTKAPKGGSTTVPAAPPTTAAPITTTINIAATKVIVANGAGIDGIAGRVSAKLKEKGYTTVEPTNAAAVGPSAVYYVAGSDAVATKVATDLGIASPTPMPAAKPVADLKGASILVVLGSTFNEAAIPKAAAPAPVTTAPPSTPASAVAVSTTKKP